MRSDQAVSWVHRSSLADIKKTHSKQWLGKWPRYLEDIRGKAQDFSTRFSNVFVWQFQILLKKKAFLLRKMPADTQCVNADAIWNHVLVDNELWHLPTKKFCKSPIMYMVRCIHLSSIETREKSREIKFPFQRIKEDFTMWTPEASSEDVCSGTSSSRSSRLPGKQSHYKHMSSTDWIPQVVLELWTRGWRVWKGVFTAQAQPLPVHPPWWWGKASGEGRHQEGHRRQGLGPLAKATSCTWTNPSQTGPTTQCFPAASRAPPS